MSIIDAIAMHVIGMLLTAIWIVYKREFDNRNTSIGQDVLDVVIWPVFLVLSVCEFFNLIDRRA